MPEEDFSSPFTSLLRRKHIMWWLYGISVVLVLFSCWLWWVRVYQSPHRVFWAMLENSLATSSVTKHIQENAQGATLDQHVSLQFGAAPLVYSTTTLNNAGGTAKTSNIGTLANDYVRYDSLVLSQKRKDGTSPDFSQVIGKWAKTPVDNAANPMAKPSYFSQTLIGFQGGNIFPIANLSGDVHGRLVKKLHDEVIFQTSFKDVQRKTENGRKVYVYEVAIQPVAYVGFQKVFAEAVGITSMKDVNPNDYQGGSVVKVTATVDVRSRQLIKIAFPNVAHSETFANYGVLNPVQVPETSLSGQGLTELLGKVR